VAAGETPPYAEHAQAAGPLSLPVMERRRKRGFPRGWLFLSFPLTHSLSLVLLLKTLAAGSTSSPMISSRRS
jgi:hypothetical protein